MQGIVKKVVDFLEKDSLQDKTIIVGFSGGFDSMCLLDVLSKIKNLPEFIDLNVVAAHYNHNWRGEEALREQEVCRIFASAKGMEFYTQTASKILRKLKMMQELPDMNFSKKLMKNMMQMLFLQHTIMMIMQKHFFIE